MGHNASSAMVSVEAVEAAVSTSILVSMSSAVRPVSAMGVVVEDREMAQVVLLETISIRGAYTPPQCAVLICILSSPL